MIIDIQQKAQKNKISTIKKKRDIIFQSYNDLKFEIEKEDKEWKYMVIEENMIMIMNWFI